MRRATTALAVAFLCVSGRGQESAPKPVDLTDEPHHVVALQNPSVRVFRLKLKPNEVTLPHAHYKFYAYTTLRPVEIANEVRGRKPVMVHLEAGDLHTSKGGFTVAERNSSSEPAEIVIVEMVKPDVEEFKTPMGGFRVHDGLYAPLFEDFGMRGYTMTMASGGHTEQHEEKYDRLVVAVSNLELQENIAGQSSSILELKAGEIRWIPRSATHATTNVGTSPATFITFEFD
jgi:quercetin dioxygenase-like cupin family protein